MADPLRPRLERLEELSKKVNAASDDAVRIVQGVESYLSDRLHIGIRGEIDIDVDENSEEDRATLREFVYGRHGPKFRFFVVETISTPGKGREKRETIFANCTRDVKLAAYRALPELLDVLIDSFGETLEQLTKSSDMIHELLPPTKGRGMRSEHRH